jgi:hypothetical protein
MAQLSPVAESLEDRAKEILADRLKDRRTGEIHLNPLYGPNLIWLARETGISIFEIATIGKALVEIVRDTVPGFDPESFLEEVDRVIDATKGQLV